MLCNTTFNASGGWASNYNISSTTNTPCTTTPLENTTSVSAGMHIGGILKIAMYICCALIFIVGTAGNTLVIYIVGIKNRLKRSYDVHIVSLSVADFLTALFVPVNTIHDLVTNLERWYLFGNFGCKWFMSTNFITQCVSASTLVVISVTRLRVIQRTTHVRHHHSTSFLQVGAIWLISLGAGIPMMINSKYSKEGRVCYDAWSQDYQKDSLYRFYYHVTYQCISCLIPIIIMVVVYSFAAVTLKERQLPGDNKIMAQKRKKQNRRIMKMFGYIVFIFFFLTTPYLISVLIVSYLIAFDEKVYWQNARVFFEINYCLLTLSLFNSCVNPFIYARMNPNVRKSFHHISSRWKTSTSSLSSHSMQQTMTFTNVMYERE